MVPVLLFALGLRLIHSMYSHESLTIQLFVYVLVCMI
jgi:hypothetical protein